MQRRMSPISRLLRYKLIVPILRGRRMAQSTARGAAVGLAVCMTPTVGVQMIAVTAIWLMLKALKPSWGFNLFVACAWTWVTNVITVGPFYYGFLITGQFMLGGWDATTGFANFKDDLARVLAIETEGIEWLWIYSFEFFNLWGVPMFIGSVPWAILAAWLGYYGSLRFLEKFRSMQRHKLVKDTET